MVDVVTVPTTISGTGSDNKDGSSNIDQQQHHHSKKRFLCTMNNHFHHHNENHPNHQYHHHHQKQQKDDNDTDYQYHPNKKIPIPSSFMQEEQLPPTTTTTNLLVSSSLNKIGSSTTTTVEERVRARYIKQQQEEENRFAYSTVTSATTSCSCSSTTSTGSMMKQQKSYSTIDPHLLLRVTDALWSFIITNNCSHRQKLQQQQQQKQIKNPTKELLNRSTDISSIGNGSPTQNFTLQDIVKILRHSIQTNVYSNSKNTNGTTTPVFLQVNTDSTTSSSSSFGNQKNNNNTISKRMIVESLIELYMNPSLYLNWITLLDPTTMKSIAPYEQSNESYNPTTHTTTTNQNVNKDLLLQYIQPNTIVQINSTISYQTIRKNIKL